MKNDMFIPSKIRVGFQSRNGTFTGKLAYIIYYDEKGKLRKEKSWEIWRDSKIDYIEFDNDPRNGYIFNKGIERYSDWGSGRSVIRVYDPRDFEFEISVDNLLGILMHSDVSKRDIVEPCVFAWYGTELVLLPTNALEYTESIKYTEKQSVKISTKDLVPGYSYSGKKNPDVLKYIGYYPKWEWDYPNTYRSAGKKHVFWNGHKYVAPAVSSLGVVVSDEVCDDYARLLHEFLNSPNGCAVAKVTFDYPACLTNVSTDPDYVSLDSSNRFAISRLSQTDDNVIETLSLAYSYRRTNVDTFSITIDDVVVSLYDVKLVGEGAIHITSAASDSRFYGYGYRYHINALNDSSVSRKELRKWATTKGYDHTGLTLDQFNELLIILGFRRMSYELTNGTVYDSKDYPLDYWYYRK